MKYPKFIDLEEPINDLDLDEAQAAMGVTLPSDLRQHYLKYNGGRPAKNCFPFKSGLYEVRWFFPVKYGKRPTQTLEGVYSLVNDVVPEGLIPFTDDSGGNLYCYSTAEATKHSICYWDHEQYNTPSHGVTVIAPSLQAFLQGLVKDPDL